MSVEHFQNLIIGSGVAGKILSWTLASQGQKTVVVERAMVGGACPNVACLPSKNVIQSAKAVSLVDAKRGLGVVTGNVRVDMAAVAHRKWKMVNELVAVHLGKFKASGAELVMGEAGFTQPKTVEVALNAGGTRQLKGDRVFINVGTRARIPNVPGLADARPMTHVEALNLERLPIRTPRHPRRRLFTWASSLPRPSAALAAASRSFSMVRVCLTKKTPNFPTV